MVYVETYYDTSIKKECFKVCEEKGYSHSTDILLTEVSTDTSNIDYAIKTFKVNVVGDRGNSMIAIYDNNTLIPFTYNNVETQYLDWTINDSEKTITLKLPYGVDHILYARYYGNRQCLGSTSQKINSYIDYPPAFATTITLTPSETSYSFDETVSITGVLKDKNNTVLGSKTIKLYVDNNLVNTVTTNSNGVFTYSSSSLANGLHTIKAVFEGTVQYFKSQSSVDISKGLDIQIVPDKFWVQGTGKITATVTDYFGTPIGSENVYCDIASNKRISGTTDNNGKVTLSNSTVLSSVKSSTSVMTNYGDSSDSFSPIFVNSFNTTVTGDTLVADGVSTELVVKAESTQQLEGLPLTTVNALPVKTYLDSSNTAKIYYNGEGAGDVTVTAKFSENLQETIEIEDLIQYWVASDKEWNANYSLSKAEVLKLAKGYKISATTKGSYGIITFNKDGAVNNWLFEFDLIAATTPEGVLIVGTNADKFKVGSHIKVTFINGVKTAYENDTVISTYTGSAYPVPEIVVGNMRVGGDITINNIKYKRL